MQPSVMRRGSARCQGRDTAPRGVLAPCRLPPNARPFTPIAAVSSSTGSGSSTRACASTTHGAWHGVSGLPSVIASAAVAEAATDGVSDVQSKAYPFPEIEARWQAYWLENKTFRTPTKVDTSKPKYYVLDMFPYPRCCSRACGRRVEGLDAAICLSPCAHAPCTGVRTCARASTCALSTHTRTSARAPAQDRGPRTSRLGSGPLHSY
jgi:hypothetical protein